MSRFNTGNPLGSGSPLDLDDNAKNMDLAVNAEQDTFQDRMGKSRLTWAGMESQFESDQSEREVQFDAAQVGRVAEFDADQSSREQEFRTFIASSGYQFAGDYAAGIEITQYNQIIRDENGEFWRASGQTELPYVTTGAGLPEGDALVPVGDAVLRQDLANPDKGALMVRGAVTERESVRELLEQDFANIGTGTVFAASGYMPGDGYGATYRWDAASTAPANEIDCIAPNGPGQPGRLLRVDPVPSKTPGRSIAESGATQEARNCSFQRGYWWGDLGLNLRRSVDGIVWEDYCTAPPISGGPAKSIIFTEDGEVLAGRGQSVYKSTGFFSNPSSVSWSEVFNWGNFPEKDANSGGMVEWSLSGYGRKAIVTHYSSSHPGQGWNRVACITTDNGETWQVAYDGHALHGSETAGHPHGVEYDRWADAFYFIEGHGTAVGVYYSYDDGANWHRIENDFTIGNGPTSITATKNGIVMCSDTADARGIYVIRRPTDRESVDEMRVSFAYELRHPDLVGDTAGIYGFGSVDLLDPRTGIVYTGWAAQGSALPCITASDGDKHGLSYIAYDQTSGTNSRAIPLYIANNNELVIRVQDGDGASGSYIKKVRLEYGSSFNDYGMDAGRIWGGNARILGGANNNNSVAVGQGSRASSRETTAVGQGAVAGNDSIATAGQVAVGYQAQATGQNSTAVGGGSIANSLNSTALGRNANVNGVSQGMAIGQNASCSGSNDAVAVGYNSSASASSVSLGNSSSSHAYSVAVGNVASTTQAECVAVGRSASCTGNQSVAVGRGASSTQAGCVSIGALSVASGGLGSIAIGQGATATEASSVAIGRGSNPTLPWQVNFGERHIAMEVLPSNPSNNQGHGNGCLYFHDDNGVIKLMAMFPNGVRKEIVSDQI